MRHPLTLAANLSSLTALAITTAITLSSCFRAEVNDTSDTSVKSVQFVIAGLSATTDSWSSSTRATLTSEGITDLWVIEGNTLLKHQNSSDADFGTPSVSLTHGDHSLTFIASRATGQSFAPLNTEGTNTSIWQCTKVSDTFGKQTTINISASAGTQQISLSRLTAKVQWTILDAIPDNATTLKISVTNHLAINPDLTAANATTFQAESNITSWRGDQGKQPNVFILPTTPDTDCPISATITILDSANSTIVTYTTATTAHSNRVTNIKGNFFATSTASEISLNTDWSTPLDVAL